MQPSELIQSKSTLNQRCSALKILCFRAKKISAEQRWFRTVCLWNSAEFFSSEQRWFRENQSWCLSCFLNQRWKTSKLWNSAVQRWLPLGLQPGFVCFSCGNVLSLRMTTWSNYNESCMQRSVDYWWNLQPTILNYNCGIAVFVVPFLLFCSQWYIRAFIWFISVLFRLFKVSRYKNSKSHSTR